MLISVINNKGGTGKTTTCLNLGNALGRCGKRVLVIDIDNQCNATDVLSNGSPDTIQKTLYDLINPEEACSPEECVYRTEYENLYMIPNIPETTIMAPKMIFSGKSSLLILRERVRQYCIENFDFTFIDCPPNLEVFVISSLCASDFVIVPTVAGSRYSFNGLIKSKNFIDDIRESFNPDLKFMKLLITMRDGRTAISRAVINEIRKSFPNDKVFKHTVPINTDFQKAEMAKQTIFKYRVGAPGAIAYKKVANELIAFAESKDGKITL